MSCAFLNCGEKCLGPEGREKSPFACPYAVMASGFHAMAQPLTVLRGALGAWKLRGSNGAESDRYIEMSTRQVERMSDLLLCLQEVLDTAESKPGRRKIDVGELVGLVMEDMTSVLQAWGGRIEAQGLDQTVQIHANADRTERAIRAALRVAASVSSPDGTIRLSAHRKEGHVEVTVEDTARHGKNLSFGDRLNLSLVETNIRSQGGKFECVEDPLCILFALPAYLSESPHPSFELHYAEAHLSP